MINQVSYNVLVVNGYSQPSSSGWLQETGAPHCVDLLQTSVAVARRGAWGTPYRQTLRNLDDAAYVAEIRAARSNMGCGQGGKGYWLVSYWWIGYWLLVGDW